MPLATRLRVVSPPALINSMKKRLNSRSLSLRPSISAASSADAMSSPGSARFAGSEFLRVAEHLRLRVARVRRAVDVGVHLFGQLVEHAPMLERDAHQVGDDHRRQLARHLRDEIACAERGDGIDDLPRHFGDAIVQPLHVARREPLVDEESQFGVLGRVHDDHHEPHLLEAGRVAVGDHHAARVRRERLAVARHRDAVAVAGERPEAGSVRLRGATRRVRPPAAARTRRAARPAM